MTEPTTIPYSRAVLSKDGIYRYSLSRDNLLEGKGSGRVVWIMLNPSTADADTDDATIRRCMRFTQDWFFGDMTVVNLFPLRATDPAALRDHQEPKDVLKTNMGYIESECMWNNPALVICAWGTHGALRMRNKQVIKKLTEIGVDMHVLRLTEDRHPSHPLYLPKNLKPIRWNGL